MKNIGYKNKTSPIFTKQSLLVPSVALTIAVLTQGCTNPPVSDDGPLTGTSAVVPADPYLNVITVDGQVPTVISSLDRSTQGGGISPLGYLLPVIDPQASSSWSPVGPKQALPENTIIGEAAGYRTLHSDVRNSDEVLSAVATSYENQWIAESNLFIVEGPTFDNDGNAYVVPLDPNEDVYIVSVDGETGARRWHIPGRRAGQGGAPLVLDDSTMPGENVLFAGSYEYVTAFSPDGTVLWDKTTGLQAPFLGDSVKLHNFGINYHPQSDSVVSISSDGYVSVHDRSSGSKLLAQPYKIPGAPAPTVPTAVDLDVIFPLTSQAVNGLFNGAQSWNSLNRLILGGEINVANYFGINPATGSLLVAATAPDDVDGTLDGLSEFGALYSLSLVDSGNGLYSISIDWRVDFAGGSASTPTISADGTKVYVADAFDQLIAIDLASGNELWSTSTGSGQIIGSLAVSADNREVYASTGVDVVKFIDQGNCAGDGTTCDVPVWRSVISNSFDLSPLANPASSQAQIHQSLGAAISGFYAAQGTAFTYELTTGNMVLAGLAANGLSMQVGLGWTSPTGIVIPYQIAQIVLDRDTGTIRSAAAAIEESVSVMASSPTGELYMANSPIRRIINLALLRAVGFQTSNPALQNFGWDAVGGIAKYAVKANTQAILADEAVLAADDRTANLIDYIANAPGDTSLSELADRRQIEILIDQAAAAMDEGLASGELSAAQHSAAQAELTEAKNDLSTSDYAAVRLNLQDFLAL